MILAGTCYSFKSEVLRGIHAEGDTYRLALFRSSASIGPQTTSYSGQSGEVPNSGGYTMGGIVLSGFSVGLTGAIAFVDFSDAIWANATITANGGLVYNSSKSNRAVAVIDFESEVVSTGGPFKVQFPANDAEHAFIALS